MGNRTWLTKLFLSLATALFVVLGGDGLQRAHAASNNAGRTLIIYFSMTGTTKQAAQQIQRDTGADIVRLRRAQPYPSGYDRMARVANRERKQNIHPAIQRNIPDLSWYKTVLIGYPTWWAQPPMVIHTLFDDYNFSGKTIIPFTTSMSTPMRDSMPTMRQLARDDGASIRNGFRYDNNKAALRRFLKTNGLVNNR